MAIGACSISLASGSFNPLAGSGDQGVSTPATVTAEAKERAAIADIVQLGGKVTDSRMASGRSVTIDLTGQREFSDQHVPLLTLIEDLHALYLARTGITNVGLNRITLIATVKELNIADTEVTNPGLKGLANLPGLTILVVGNRRLPNNVTTQGLKEIGKLPELRLLFLTGVRVTDAGLNEL